MPEPGDSRPAKQDQQAALLPTYPAALRKPVMQIEAD
jgi:hypothetical protein